MFRSRIRSVVPLDHHYLARHDGSEQALGRGSGLDVPPEEEQKKIGRTPYMNMVYAPVERRLDTAVFRALFASSTRQARQFVVHGYVKVNGKKVSLGLKSVIVLDINFTPPDGLPGLPTQSRRHVPSRAGACSLCNRRPEGQKRATCRPSNQEKAHSILRRIDRRTPRALTIRNSKRTQRSQSRTNDPPQPRQIHPLRRLQLLPRRKKKTRPPCFSTPPKTHSLPLSNLHNPDRLSRRPTPRTDLPPEHLLRPSFHSNYPRRIDPSFRDSPRYTLC